jgi:hypothetical protein
MRVPLGSVKTGGVEMRKIGFVVALAILFTSQLAAATVVEIPLPDLGGRYFLYETYQRSCLFSLPGHPAIIHSASLRLVGTATIRMTWCAIYPSEPYAELFGFGATMPDATTGGAWGAGLSRAESGAFDLMVPFAPYSGASWGFLDDGTGEVTLSGGGCPILDSCWPVTECSEANVEQAFLVLDAEFPIPVEQSTWGRVKALFGE